MLARSVLVLVAVLLVVFQGCSGDEFTPAPGGGSPTGGTGGDGGAIGGGGTGGTGGGIGGNTGGGGTGGVACFDDDKDGVTDCEGDCDDDDPTSYPGASEICGDGADNDCDGSADPQAFCQGIGTFVSKLTGDDINGDGTQQNPVETINQGIINAQTIGGGVDVYVAEGTYAEKVQLVETIDLLGGHQCDTNQCTWQRTPTQYDSAIVNVDMEGVLADDTITRATRLDGFRVMGLGGAVPNGVTSAAISVLQGTATISNNRVYGGAVPQCIGSSWCTSAGIVVQGVQNDPAGALIESNAVYAGDCVSSSTGILLQWGGGGGAIADIAGNQVEGGAGRWSRAISAGAAEPGTLIRNNEAHAGNAVGQHASSFAMYLSGDSVVDSNRFNTDPGKVGACPDPPPDFWCGGIESEGATTVLTNNVVYGMPSWRSVALYMGEGEIAFGSIVASSNTLHGGGFPSQWQGSISSALVCKTTQGVAAQVGQLRNNILLGGEGTNRFGMYEQQNSNDPTRTCEPVAYENNDIYFAAQIGAVDNAHRRWPAGGPEVLLPTVSDVNSLSFAQNNLGGDPLLDATHHLQSGSPCIDAGTATDAPSTDMDGEARPQGGGYDIGADEAP